MFKVGDKVSMVEGTPQTTHNECYPAPGVIGEIISISPRGNTCCVQWPQGTTDLDGKWYADVDCLKLEN